MTRHRPRRASIMKELPEIRDALRTDPSPRCAYTRDLVEERLLHCAEMVDFSGEFSATLAP